MKVTNATIVQITTAPAPLYDDDGNEYVGYALVDLEGERDDGTHWGGRDILPYGSEGGIIGLPAVAYYAAHALGDDRPPFASFRTPRTSESPLTPLTNHTKTP